MSNGYEGATIALDANDGATEIAPPVAVASNWKKFSTTGEWFTLPGNGEVALLKRPSLMALAARASNLANPLSAEVVRWLANQGDPLRNNPTPEAAVQQYKKNSAAFVAIAQECFIEPRIVSEYQCAECAMVFGRDKTRCPNSKCNSAKFDWREADYDNGEISPYDLGDFDYAWLVFSFVEGDAARIARFRVGAGRSGAITRDSGGLRTEAQ